MAGRWFSSGDGCLSVVTTGCRDLGRTKGEFVAQGGRGGCTIRCEGWPELHEGSLSQEILAGKCHVLSS